MIAWAGIERYKINLIDNLKFPSKARWPLDSFGTFLKRTWGKTLNEILANKN